MDKETNKNGNRMKGDREIKRNKERERQRERTPPKTAASLFRAPYL